MTVTTPSPVRLPFWLRKPPTTRRIRKPALTPAEPRWWIGVIWLVLSALLLGFVAHVTLVGSLQHARSQQTLYQELRSSLALATSPLGQLDVDGVLVPDGTPIGVLSIQTDDVSIEEVFVQGTTGGVLTAGPGHRRDTVMPGQEGTSILMARQATYGGPFGYLAALEPGDLIRVTTGQGVAKYEVFGVRREGELLPQALANGEGRLELITADGSPLLPAGTLHIDAELVSSVQETPAPVLTKEVLSSAEQAMAGDPSGWLPTLFWAQLLIVAAVATRWVRSRWGMWQTATIAVPILVPLAAATSNAAMTLLPNLL
ncbi:sortase domain-bontaining protein [Pseudolysinimonas sp.]|uniref:sortase domain-containing protein n=1 Tax=Pseudolysinimonas sp. TaxID=2680009 RepID=UPI00286B6982|nr:sortase [Pseudolysinimonas sp.]